MRAVAGDCVLTAARVVNEEVFVEAAGGGIEELKVGRDEREGEEGKEGGWMHCYCCCSG